MVIPKTRLDQFEKEWADGKWSGCRKGQAFYNFMDFHKSTDPDKEGIYEMKDLEFNQWVRTDLDPIH